MNLRAAIVGVGGLGAPAAVALAHVGAALSLFDPDRVELSNLPRQPAFGEADLGEEKAECCARRLRAEHTGLDVRAHVATIGRDNGAGLLGGHHVIVDATDGMTAKVLLNDLALELGVPLVHAGVLGLDGQLMTIVPRRSACLRCLFVELPPEDEIPSCQQAGILGPVVGAIGLAAAREAHAVLEDRSPPLENRLAILNGAALKWRQIALRRNPSCPRCT
ncbi:MAG: HesA/MoeB/ThiF family protein [Candidatus Binatia bacterium]|nr:HesA/MoeB/ThiF family protein [Candidatus Binatia bacterium]